MLMLMMKMLVIGDDDDDDDVKRLLMVQCLVQGEGESLILEVGQFMNIIGSL